GDASRPPSFSQQPTRGPTAPRRPALLSEDPMSGPLSWCARFVENRSARRPVRRSRPAVEALEDRSLPAIIAPSSAAADGQANSVRAAVIEANRNNQDDTITLQAGTYQLFLPNANGQENAAATGDLDLTEAGHTITFQGAGAGVTVIDGGS